MHLPRTWKETRGSTERGATEEDESERIGQQPDGPADDNASDDSELRAQQEHLQYCWLHDLDPEAEVVSGMAEAVEVGEERDKEDPEAKVRMAEAAEADEESGVYVNYASNRSPREIRRQMLGLCGALPSDSPSSSSVAQSFIPEYAPSAASTQPPSEAGATPRHRSPHGRAGALARGEVRWSVCNCRCTQTPASSLGPHNGQRCSCPMCGHRSIHHGHGCHFRISVRRGARGVVLCDQCQVFCLTVLRWADHYYEDDSRRQNRA